MKILIYSHIIPYPLNEGGKTAQFYLIKEMLKYSTIYFSTPVTNIKDENLLKDLQLELPELNIRPLKIASKSEITSNIFYKVLNKIYWHLGRAIKKYFITKHAILDNKFFLNPIQIKSQVLTDAFVKLLSDVVPDIVQVEYIDNADLVDFVPPSCKKVLVMHDLRYSTVMQAAAIRGYSSSYVNYIGNIVKHRELPYLEKYDCVLVFSKEDEIRLKSEGIDKVYVAPFTVSSFSEVKCQVSEDKPKRLVLLGPDYHEPNRDALEWFTDNCYDSLYSDFQLPIEVIGEWSSTNRRRFKKYPSIHFKGFVPDLQKALQDSIMIVPLRMGSGIRTKILDAFFLGVPVITTPIGVEGLGLKNGEHCLLAENPDDFITEIVRLSSNIGLVTSLKIKAFDFAKTNFNNNKVGQKRLEIYKLLLSKIT